MLRHDKIILPGVCGADAMAVGVARVGQADQLVVYGSLAELSTVDFGAPLHSLVLVGETDEIEREMLELFRVTASTPRTEFTAAPLKDST